MFNAVNGLGAGGQFSAKAADNANSALYSAFAIVGFCSGSITNVLGIKTALSFGGLGYSVYISAYLCYNHTQNYGYVIFSGFLLGCCAGVLWSAQGQIMLSYPPEASKGRYIFTFWAIFNMGGVIGGLVRTYQRKHQRFMRALMSKLQVPLGQNIDATEDTSVTDGTYIGFLVLTFSGACLAWILVDAKHVVRMDGSRVILQRNPTWKSEVLGLWETLFTDPYIMLLFPMFFASNWFYTYQWNVVNLARFNLRTRTLNNVLYWIAQIIGAMTFGFALDYSGLRRTSRAVIAWIVLFMLTFAIWGFGYSFQRTYTREEMPDGAGVDDSEKMDWTSPGFIGPMFLYMFYGFYDAAWQTCVYW